MNKLIKDIFAKHWDILKFEESNCENIIILEITEKTEGEYIKFIIGDLKSYGFNEVVLTLEYEIIQDKKLINQAINALIELKKYYTMSVNINGIHKKFIESIKELNLFHEKVYH
jgi:hypothetical protein